MHKFIKNHQKKLMVFLGIGLMIVFIVPTAFTQMGNQNPVIGTLNGSKIHYREFAQSEQDWQLLMTIPTIVWNQGQPQIAPIPYLLGINAVSQINQHSNLYVILQQEAQQMGVTGSEEQIDQLLKGAAMASSNQSFNTPAVYGALTRFLPVLNAWNQIAGTIQISDPMVRQEQASQQMLQIKLVSFDAAPASAPTTQPSEQDLQKQFDQFAGVTPGLPDARNPFGFGYRYPNRIKLQYITVPFAQVREVVEGSKSAYNWSVEENRYYLQHLGEFATTQPATASSSTTQSSQKPFEAVQHDIHEKLVHEQTLALAKSIQEQISSTLNTDYLAFSRSAAASTHPTSSLGVPYDSFEYLQKLRDKIESETKVRLGIHQVADLKDEDGLATLDGIAQAEFKNESFAQYAMTNAAPFTPADQQSAQALKLFQPSGILSSALLDTYVFRLTAAEPAHTPASLAEVKAQVVSDLQHKAAFEHEKQAATQFLDSLSKADTDFDAAAAAANLPILNLGPVYHGAPIPQYPLGETALQSFQRQIQKLLQQASETHLHPAILIELPTAGKLAVVQLQSVRALWDNDTEFYMKTQIDLALQEQIKAGLQQSWFDYDTAVRRTGYRATDRIAQPAPQGPPPPML